MYLEYANGKKCKAGNGIADYRMRTGMWQKNIVWMLVVLLIFAGCSGARVQPKPRIKREGISAAHQLLPGDLDVVMRVDWSRIRQGGYARRVVDYAVAFGVHADVPLVLEGCLEQAKVVWLGLRARPSAPHADAIVAIEGASWTGEPAGVDKHPCGARGWTRVKETSLGGVYEPSRRAQGIGEPAMILAIGQGDFILATTAEIDPVLRMLRDGAESGRLEPDSSGVLGVEARGGEASLPQDLKNKFPLVASLARGLERTRLSFDLDGRLSGRGTLSYRNPVDADKAAEALTQIRAALMASSRKDFQDLAQGAHASVVDEMLKVHFVMDL